MNTMTPSTFTSLWKPTFPFATDDFSNGMRRMKRESAIEKRFIESSPKTMRNLIVLDIDIDDSFRHVQTLVHDDEKIPEPNFVTINPASSHAHVGFFIDGFAHTHRALSYLDDIAHGLQIVSAGDAAYGGRTMRNPLHSLQNTVWGTDELYTLETLANYAKGAEKGTRAVPSMEFEVGEGRNALLFEALRKWSYRARLRFETYDAWELAALERANELNFSFEKPLTPSEVHSIVKSNAKWVWEKFDNETFSKIQKARVAKTAHVVKAPERHQAVKDMLEAGFKIAEIADNLGCSYNAAKMLVSRVKRGVTR